VAAAAVSPFVVVAVTDGSSFGEASLSAGISVGVLLVSTVWIGGRMQAPADDVKLVLLRVFGSPQRARFLFDIAERWRGLGTVVCISAPDVSTHQMEPDDLVEVLFGMPRVRFAYGDLHENESVARLGRLGRPPALRRVVEIPASANQWQQEMRYLLMQNAIVLIDLRGFTADNRGCEFELGVLVDKFLLDATVILIDETTDVETVTQVLTHRWMAMASSSPNMHRASDRLELFKLESTDDGAARAIVRRLCTARMASSAQHQLVEPSAPGPTWAKHPSQQATFAPFFIG
jgi:hypothetical protein